MGKDAHASYNYIERAGTMPTEANGNQDCHL